MNDSITTEALPQLALFGGTPRFEEPLHVGRPNIGNEERFFDRLRGALDRRWLTNSGPLVQEFEAKLADFLGVRHVIAMCNATVALEIASRAIGMRGEVIVPSFTFVATAHALQWQEITPVFCDVDPHTHCIDPDRIEAMITPRTTGILGVHVWGQACDVERLTDIAERHSLHLLFDAAHAFGCTHKGQRIGGFGDAEVFSFHATKFFNTFEGGAVTTNNDELAKRMRLMRNFGFAGTDNVVYVGTNGKMSEVSAAMGLTSLESCDHFVQANQRNYDQYRTELADLPGLRFFTYDSEEENNFQYVVVELDDQVAGLSRDELVEVLWAENVRARRYFYPGVHMMEPYRSFFPHAGLLLPQTEVLSQRVFLLPSGTSVGVEEIDAICQIIRAALAQKERVRACLAASKEPQVTT